MLESSWCVFLYAMMTPEFHLKLKQAERRKTKHEKKKTRKEKENETWRIGGTVLCSAALQRVKMGACRFNEIYAFFLCMLPKVTELKQIIHLNQSRQPHPPSPSL